MKFCNIGDKTFETDLSKRKYPNVLAGDMFGHACNRYDFKPGNLFIVMHLSIVSETLGKARKPPGNFFSHKYHVKFPSL